MAKSIINSWRKELGVIATAAVGLIVALAWNELIQMLIQRYIPIEDDLLAQVIYVVIVTALLIVVAFLIADYLQ